MHLDRTDVRILEQLQLDGRIRIRDLAAKVGLSATPCARRVSRLEDEGVISGYSAQIDAKAIGLPLTAFVSIELDHQNAETLQNFEGAVSDFEEVIDCFLMTGSQDYLMMVAAADLESYEKFLQEKLTRVSGIRSVRSRFALRRVLGRGIVPRGQSLGPKQG